MPLRCLSAVLAPLTVVPDTAAPRRVRRASAQAQLALREAAIDAALQLYRQHGLQALTMRAVADAVAVSPMALYRYFDNKSALLAAMGEFALHELATTVHEAVPRDAPASVQIRVSTEAFIGYWEAHPDHYRLVYLEAGDPADPLQLPQLNDSPVYARLLAQSGVQFAALADELGVSHARVAAARDLRLVLVLGYLQARLVVRRYPWDDLAALRRSAVETAVHAAIGCLRAGGPAELPA